MPRFGQTGRLVARADRSEDPFRYIDDLRQEVFELGEELERQQLEIQALKNANVDRLTQSGVWTIVKSKLDAQRIDWMRWALRCILGAIIAGAFGLAFKLAGWFITRMFAK